MKQYDYTGLDFHFREVATLNESKESVMEAATALAKLPATDDVKERAKYAKVIAYCLSEYSDLLNRIGEEETNDEASQH